MFSNGSSFSNYSSMDSSGLSNPVWSFTYSDTKSDPSLSLFSNTSSSLFSNTSSSLFSNNTPSLFSTNSSLFSSNTTPLFTNVTAPATNINNNDVQWLVQNYKNMAKEFTKHYYHSFANSIDKLESLYMPTAMITFMDHECVGFKALLKILQSLGWKGFKVEVESIDAQPLGGKKLIMMIAGYINYNDFTRQRFTEFISLVKNSKDGRFYIQCQMFRKFA